MKKTVYSWVQNGVELFTVSCPVPKEFLEKQFGPLSDEQYEALVKEKNDAKMARRGAIKMRVIDDADLPADREFRGAWCDISASSKVDIDIAKAKELKLAELREKRNKKLAESDEKMVRAMESEDEVKKAELKALRKALRDATEPLKAVEGSGVASEAKLAEIRSKAVLPE